MARVFLFLRMIVEGLIGFLILLVLPFTAIALVHSHGTVTRMLVGFLILTVMFLLGIVLFRDAVVLRMRLK